MNPLCYRPHGIKSLTLKVDNRSILPILTPSNTKSGFLQAYMQYIKTQRFNDQWREIVPTYKNFAQGPTCLFGWDLSADLSNNLECPKIGSLSLDCVFEGKATEKGLVGIMCGFFQSTLFMDNLLGVAVYDTALDKMETLLGPGRSRG